MITIRDIEDADWSWVEEKAEPLGGTSVVAGGFLHRLKDHTAIIAEDDGKLFGFAVYSTGGVRWEILGILSVEPRMGVGSRMLEEIERRAKQSGAAQLRISTTNDNFPAMRFCQLRGYTMRQLIPGAFLEAKKLKGLPADEPVEGLYGIEIRDEIILNKNL